MSQVLNITKGPLFFRVKIVVCSLSSYKILICVTVLVIYEMNGTPFSASMSSHVGVGWTYC